jgi:hypothetical protein
MRMAGVQLGCHAWLRGKAQNQHPHQQRESVAQAKGSI